MHPLTTSWPRLVRGLVVAATCVLVSLSGHLLAGGPPALTDTLLAAVAAVTGVCLLASRWRWTFRRLVAVALSAQPVFHVVFSLGHPVSNRSQPVITGDHHAEGSHARGQLMPGAEPELAVDVLTALYAWAGEPVMLAGHGAAGVALAALLARGESLAWRVVALFLAALTRWIVRRARVIHVSPVRTLPTPQALDTPHTLFFLPASPRRGPPAASRPAPGLLPVC